MDQQIQDVARFLQEATRNTDLLNDFGYLLIANDDQLNAEAMSIIRRKFSEFLEQEYVE